jgi:TRAP-type C4-dicarboxylate transport system substrate-binding protein
MNRKMIAVWPCAALALVMAGANAGAQQPVKLRVADSFPNGHFISEKITKPWIAKIHERTKGAVALEYYPAEQLGKAKDVLSLTSSGVVDIGYVAPAFVGDKLPLSVVAELPIDFKSSCEASPAFYKLSTGDGILAKNEFGPNNVRVLWTVVLVPYQVMLGEKVRLEGLKSLQGLKIRTTGGAKELAVRKLGAVPVQIPSPEVYESVTRGTVDGALWPYTSVYSYGMDKAFYSSTVGENFGSFVVTYVINERKWKSLPPNVQKAIADVSEETVKKACDVADAEDVEAIAKLRAAGWKIPELSAPDKAELRSKLGSVSKEWAEGLDKRGKPGSAVLKAYEDELRKHKK